MYLWIDDERVEPKGWLRSSDCANAISAIELYAPDLEAISFDYDIGVVGNGGDVAQYVRDNWKAIGLRSTVRFNIHSGNPSGTKRTKKILEEIYEIWQRDDEVTVLDAKAMWREAPSDFADIKLPPFKQPRPNSLVKFKKGYHSPKDEEKYYKYLLDKTYIYLGDIVNQPGHCILIELSPENADLDGRLELFRHTADFEELSEDEI